MSFRRTTILVLSVLSGFGCIPKRDTKSKLAASEIIWKRSGTIYNFLPLCGSDNFGTISFPDLFDHFVTQKSVRPFQVVDGADSGVVVDHGYRFLYQFSFYLGDSLGCTERQDYELRFSKDVVGTDIAWEVFVKNVRTKEVIGLAVDAQGQELREVPREIAFDKAGNKDFAKGFEVSGPQKEIVLPRNGCFSCHHNGDPKIDDGHGVSTDYGVKDAEAFWKDAIRVEKLQEELVAEARHARIETERQLAEVRRAHEQARAQEQRDAEISRRQEEERRERERQQTFARERESQQYQPPVQRLYQSTCSGSIDGVSFLGSGSSYSSPQDAEVQAKSQLRDQCANYFASRASGGSRSFSNDPTLSQLRCTGISASCSSN